MTLIVNSYPAVSGILPVKDGEFWVDSSIPNILASLRPIDELIVIDDSSSDGTLSKLRAWAGRDSRISIYKSSFPGIVGALNLGFSKAKNLWISRFDIDDRYPPDRITRQLDVAQNRTHELAAVFSDYEIWENGERFAGLILSPLHPIHTKVSLVNSQRTAHPSALINKDSFFEVGGYKSEEFPAEDLGLWMRLAEIGNLESVPFVGLYYNLNRTSISSKLRVQAIKKRRELVSKLGFSKVEIDSIAKVLDDIDLGYSPDADSLARKWLFLRDLYTLRNINSKAEFKLGDLRRQTRNLLFQGFDRSTSSQILYFLRRRLMRTRLKSKSRP